MTVKRGDQVFINEDVAKTAMEIKPSYLSKTGWFNFLIAKGVEEITAQEDPGFTLGGK